MLLARYLHLQAGFLLIYDNYGQILFLTGKKPTLDGKDPNYLLKVLSLAKRRLRKLI